MAERAGRGPERRATLASEKFPISASAAAAIAERSSSGGRPRRRVPVFGS
ncbi:hypothetical protein KIH74_13900 [Kineosporia sp. J2-2]|uniref:Uncharacterized protein n=1 Tax=Kineosporia corallincola TaxID=2835133 RepID=A0ABS5TG38_9ACTN|nr:hypothetical protein [Kineosporia corallincola]MBT0770027.1 hypothetical protein [Kineosporia corallincola]